MDGQQPENVIPVVPCIGETEVKNMYLRLARRRSRLVGTLDDRYVCWCGRRCSGGTEVTVTGENVDAAAQPYISVTVVVTSFNHTDHDDDNDPTTVTSEVFCQTTTIHW